MNKVVKCKNKKCEQYFMHTGKDAGCPFCYIKYGEVEEETKDLSAQTGKKWTTKTKKESFKIWKGS